MRFDTFDRVDSIRLLTGCYRSGSFNCSAIDYKSESIGGGEIRFKRTLSQNLTLNLTSLSDKNESIT